MGCGCLALVVCVVVCELVVLTKYQFSPTFTQSGVTSFSYERLIDCLCCFVHSNTHCCVCLSYYPGHVRGCRSVSATDGILTGSRMVRLTAQQRSELVQLHLQGESIDAIVRQTGHARTTVLRWVRGFTVAGSLSDRTRSGRPVTVMTPTVVGRIKQLAKAKRGCRSRSTRQVAATLSSRGTLISQTSVCRALDSKGVKPMSNLRCRCSGMATSSGDCASRLSRRNVIGDAVCSRMRRHLCVIPAPIVATTSSGLMTPAPSNPSCVLPTLSPSTPSVLSLHRANRLCSFFLRILLHRSTSRFLNPLCCRQREIGSLADTGPIYKTAIQSTLQN